MMRKTVALIPSDKGFQTRSKWSQENIFFLAFGFWAGHWLIGFFFWKKDVPFYAIVGFHGDNSREPLILQKKKGWKPVEQVLPIFESSQRPNAAISNERTQSLKFETFNLRKKKIFWARAAQLGLFDGWTSCRRRDLVPEQRCQDIWSLSGRILKPEPRAGEDVQDSQHIFMSCDDQDISGTDSVVHGYILRFDMFIKLSRCWFAGRQRHLWFQWELKRRNHLFSIPTTVPGAQLATFEHTSLTQALVKMCSKIDTLSNRLLTDFRDEVSTYYLFS